MRKFHLFFSIGTAGMIVSLLSVFLLLSCGSSDEVKSAEDNDVVISKPFTEGAVEMGIFSEDIDLGAIINKIDFSRNDVKQQYENLVKNDTEAKGFFELITKMGNQNPLVAWAMTMNVSESIYNIKNDEVLANVRGFGWNMHNYHNASQDKGSIYLETLTSIDQISDHDRKIYTVYKPSENSDGNAVNAVDFSEFNRDVKNTKLNISGYECSVVEYTAKIINDDTPMQLQKIVVYTSPLFSKTINFTHPFYLVEDGGILRLDIYYLNKEEPTLIMKPKAIKEKAISKQDLTSKATTPVYSTNDINWGIKSLAIMMSGWGAVKN